MSVSHSEHPVCVLINYRSISLLSLSPIHPVSNITTNNDNDPHLLKGAFILTMTLHCLHEISLREASMYQKLLKKVNFPKLLIYVLFVLNVISSYLKK